MAAPIPGTVPRVFVARGLNEFISELKAMPAEIERAEQAAINGMLTKVRTEIVNTIHADTGLKKKIARQRLIPRRARPSDLHGFLTATPGPNLLLNYDVKKTKISPTRVAVEANVFIGGRRKTGRTTFINPKYDAGKAYRRPIDKSTGKPKGKRKVLAKGPSMAFYMYQIVTPKYENQKLSEFNDLFAKKLDGIIKRRK